jgi:hypothetical protein
MLENICNGISLLKNYDAIFHSDITQKYIDLMEILRLDDDSTNRKRANDELLRTFSLDHISVLERYVVRENNKEMIKQYKGRKRKSKRRPYAMHPVSVVYLLSSLGLEAEILMAAGNHDSIEADIKDQRKSKMGHDQLDIYTYHRIAQEYNNLLEIISKASARLREESAEDIEAVTPFNKKTILYACIITEKVTRYESDRNYPISVDKIIDENISLSNPQFKLLFFEYLRDIKNGDPITESDLIKFKNQLTLSKAEIDNIIVGAWFVKLADRLSNTKDTYEEQSLSEKITDLFKNFIVIDALRAYLKNSDGLVNHVTQEKLDKLNLLSDFLLHVSIERLIEERRCFDLENRNNLEFHKWKQETSIDEKIKQYALAGGFRIVDCEVKDDVASGLIVSLFDKTLNKDETAKNLLDVDACTQYRALESLKGIFNEYKKDPNFTIDNIGIIRSSVSRK